MIRTRGTIALLITVMVLVAIGNGIGYVHAAGIAIDGTPTGSGVCSGSCSVTLSTSNSNDVVILLVGGYTGSSLGVGFGTPTASGLTFNTRQTHYAQLCPGGPVFCGGLFAGEWWAVASSPLSSETITLTESNGAQYSMVAYGVSGANTVTPFDSNVAVPAVADNTGSPTTSSTVTLSTSNANDLILGIVGGGTNVGGGSAGTPSFTIWSVSGNPAAAEYEAVSSTQSGLTVTINFGAEADWAMIGDAVQAAAMPPPPIPEYPLGLPILALLTVFAYGLVRRRTQTRL